MFKLNLEFEKKIIINKSATEIHAILSDLDHWNQWSPWICLDPEAITSVGKNEAGLRTLSWNGKLIGSGTMNVTSKTSTRIDYQLNFLTPFKSEAIAYFQLNHISNLSCEVVWGMKSAIPLFLFFLKNMMTAYLGNDYERGLTRLKEYVETGVVNSKLSSVDKTEQAPIYVLAKKVNGPIANLSMEMNQIFDGAMKDIESRNIPVPDGFISLYYKFDIVKKTSQYASGVFYYQKPSAVSGYEIIEFKKHQNLKLTLQGGYNHLPTAWSKIFCYQRANKIPLDKKTPFYELYLNSPKMVAPENVLTELRLPIK